MDCRAFAVALPREESVRSLIQLGGGGQYADSSSLDNIFLSFWRFSIGIRLAELSKWTDDFGDMVYCVFIFYDSFLNPVLSKGLSLADFLL